MQTVFDKVNERNLVKMSFNHNHFELQVSKGT